MLKQHNEEDLPPPDEILQKAVELGAGSMDDSDFHPLLVEWDDEAESPDPDDSSGPPASKKPRT